MKLDNKKLNKMKLVGSFFSLAAVAVIIIFALGVGLNRTLGWFADNQNVTASGMNAGVNGLSYFELAVSGSETTPYGDNAAIVTYLAEDTNGGYEKVVKTSDAHTALLCNMAIDSSHSGLSANEIGPGSYGHVSFDIVINDTDDHSFVLDFSYQPAEKDVDGNPTPISAANLATVRDLLTGHVLIFTGIDANGYYSGHLDSMSLTYNTADHASDHTTLADGEHYKVTLYWVWPMTYATIAYAPPDSRLQSLDPIFATTGDGPAARSSMITYMQTNPDYFFYNLDDSVDLTDNNFYNTYYVKLSEGYNEGDQFIGDNVYYFILGVDANMIS